MMASFESRRPRRISLRLSAWLLFPVVAACQTPRDAQTLEAQGNWAGAEAEWRALARAHPGDYRLWTSLGIAVAHQGRYAEAIEAYQKALSLRPRAPQAEFNLGVAYFKSGNLEKAVPPLEAAAAQLPHTPQVNLLLGMSLYGTGKYSAAVPLLERAHEADPGNRELSLVLAQAYLWAGDYGKAKLQFQSMLERDPDSPQVHMLLGEACDALGNTGDAIAEFNIAAQSGTLPDAHFALGYLLWKAKRYEDAAPEFRSELSSDPKYYKALAYLGDSEFRLGQYAAARRDLYAAASLHDILWITRFDLGKLEEHDRNWPGAVRQYKRAIELDSTRPEAHYRLARVFQAEGDGVSARKELGVVAHLQERDLEDSILKVTGATPSAPRQ